MVAKYAPQLEGFITTNHVGATGDGIEMATELGAGLTDIEQIQTHPTVNPDTATMYTERVRGNGAILVNDDGKRFVNELDTRDVVSAAIMAQQNGESWLVFDTAVRESLSAIEKYINEGIIVEAN
ncbi:FAD-binding protein, partial [uncultured Porphyromonas sp.]|uniref:FAD-binding protein n=1 Tax=uncultured Porphyromonas sp. TaxID=159274 RepID=UPI00258B7BA7